MGRPLPSLLHFHPHPGLTSNAQGEVLAAAGLPKGVLGTAGVEATVLWAGRPEGQVSLLAADRVIALAIREGVPISEPLIGGPAMPRASAAGRHRVLRQAADRVQNRRVRARLLSLQMGQARPLSLQMGLGRGCDLHRNTQQFRGIIRLSCYNSQHPEFRIIPQHKAALLRSLKDSLEQPLDRGGYRMKRGASEESPGLGTCLVPTCLE